MVTSDQIIELGFLPGLHTHYHIKYNGNELSLKYSAKTSWCTIKYNNKKLWMGKISSIEQLEDKLQELNGEY